MSSNRNRKCTHVEPYTKDICRNRRGRNQADVDHAPLGAAKVVTRGNGAEICAAHCRPFILSRQHRRRQTVKLPSTSVECLSRMLIRSGEALIRRVVHEDIYGAAAIVLLIAYIRAFKDALRARRSSRRAQI